MCSGVNIEIKTITIVGVGLIGGSFARAIKVANPDIKIIGTSRNAEKLEEALNLSVIDAIDLDLKSAVLQADLVMIAAPVYASNKVLETIAPWLTERQFVTDVGSVKQGIVDCAEAVLGPHLARFVAGHPIAGRELSGVAASKADLFEHHKVVLTPTAATHADTIRVVRQLWQQCGAEVFEMSVAQHDRVLAMTSHFPHLLAFSMMNFLMQSVDHENCRKFTAGGFYDFTRTASSDPRMWSDIFIMNKQAMINNIEDYQRLLEQMREFIDNEDDASLMRLFTEAGDERALIAFEKQQRMNKQND